MIPIATNTGRKIWPIVLLFSLSAMNCRDRFTEVPYVPVDIWININEPQWFNITVPSGWEYVTGGSRGIILYRNNLEEFTALERHSPYEADQACAVIVKDDNITVEDPCSGSQWLIMDGTIMAGPTSQPLVTYDVTFNDPILHITN
jgi:hypothetical protein